MDVVYVRESLCVAWSAGTTMLKKGDAWDADAALVRERPGLFTEEPGKVHGRRSGPPMVERATRAPGEVRKGPGRPRKPRDDDGNIIREPESTGVEDLNPGE